MDLPAVSANLLVRGARERMQSEVSGQARVLRPKAPDL